MIAPLRCPSSSTRAPVLSKAASAVEPTISFATYLVLLGPMGAVMVLALVGYLGRRRR